MKTITRLFPIILLLFIPIFSTAQGNIGEFKWGLKGGVNFANLTNLGEIEKESGKLGFVGGAFAKIPLNHQISIRPELLFNMKGGVLNLPNDIGSTDEGRFKLNYAELPVSLDFEFYGIFDFHAGVQGAFLISKKLKLNGENFNLNDDFFNNSEFGWHIGTGIDLGNLGIHVRFQQSLSSFSKDQPDFEPRNWGISLTASYMFIN